MKLLLTKTMFNTLKKAMADNERTKDYEMITEKLTNEQYCFYVGSYGGDLDFDYRDGKYKVFKIIYPSEYYATPRYITTEELQWIFKRSNKTLEDFLDKFIDLIEI